MLILTRQKNERIIIKTPGGEIIKVNILKCIGQVKIGIEADKNVIVHREEIWNKIYPEEKQ